MTNAARFSRHHEVSLAVGVSPERLFAHLDDQTRLAAHMERPSLMTGGGRMTYDFDAGRGQAIGSHIRMGGQAFGLNLFVDEVVTERDPPRRKVWRTMGQPRLLIVNGYEMGFEIDSTPAGAALRVWIDYDPAPGLGRIPGLASAYARWCVARMASDAQRTFGAAAVQSSATAAHPSA